MQETSVGILAAKNSSESWAVCSNQERLESKQSKTAPEAQEIKLQLAIVVGHAWLTHIHELHVALNGAGQA